MIIAIITTRIIDPKVFKKGKIMKKIFLSFYVLFNFSLGAMVPPEQPMIGANLTYKDVGKQNLDSIKGRDEFKIPIAAGGDVQKFIERQKNILFNLAGRLKNTISYGILNTIEQQ